MSETITENMASDFLHETIKPMAIGGTPKYWPQSSTPVIVLNKSYTDDIMQIERLE